MSIANIKDFGVKSSDDTLDTVNIQATINAVSDHGGGMVYVPPGKYETAAIMMRSGVVLCIPKGAMISASKNPADWKGTKDAVINAAGAKNIAVIGEGTIDGGGLVYYDSAGHFVGGNRPNGILSLCNSQDVSVGGITLQNSAGWTLKLSQCDYAYAGDVIVRNRDSRYGYTNDGIDVVDSRHVVVTGCDIMTGDDGICVKSIGDAFQTPERDSFDILIENNTIASTGNALKTGCETRNNIYNVTFRNNTVKKYVDKTGYAAIAVESNFGGAVHDFTCDGLIIDYCDTPIFLELQKMLNSLSKNELGQLYNIMLKNISCSYSMKASQINTQKGATIKNVTLDNLDIHNVEKYRGSKSPAYLTGSYPEAWACGPMPAYGLFARNVEGLTVNDNCKFYDDGNSGRQATVFENVTH